MFGDAQIAANLAYALALGQFDFCLPQQAEIFEMRGSVARMDRVSMRPTPPNECMKTKRIVSEMLALLPVSNRPSFT
jgi:hypothetical protein